MEYTSCNNIPVLDVGGAIYCANSSNIPLAVVLLCFWIISLFWVMAHISSGYLAVNLASLCRMLQLPENVAGVTILALGSASTDLITNLLSVTVLEMPEMGLGEVVGAGMMSSSLVMGCVMLAAVVAVGIISYFVTFGPGYIEWFYGPVLLIIYFFYLVTVIVTNRFIEKKKKNDLKVPSLTTNITRDMSVKKSYRRAKMILASYETSGDYRTKMSFRDIVHVLCAYKKLTGKWPGQANTSVSLVANDFSEIHSNVLFKYLPSSREPPVPVETCSTCSSLITCAADAEKYLKVLKYHYFPLLGTWKMLNVGGKFFCLFQAPLDFVFGSFIPSLQLKHPETTSTNDHHIFIFAQQLLIVPFAIFAMIIGLNFVNINSLDDKISVGQQNVAAWPIVGFVALLCFVFVIRSLKSRYAKHTYVGLSFIGAAISILTMLFLGFQLVSSSKILASLIGMNPSIAGITILAIGNTIQDLASNITLATMGSCVSAFSSTIGAPILNFLFSYGIMFTYLAMRKGPDGKEQKIEKDFPLISGLITILACSFLAFLFILIARFKTNRIIGGILVALYPVGLGMLFVKP